jgi:hypothetical protein
MEFIHIRKCEVRIFCGSAKREKRIKAILKKFAELIKELQAELR